MKNPQFWVDHIEGVFIKEFAALWQTIHERLLPTFDRIETEADAVSDNAWQRFSESADTDFEPGTLAETAQDAGINHYLMLVEIKQGLTNLFAIALHHLLQQQQLLLLRRELVPWGRDNDISIMKLSEFVVRLKQSRIDVTGYSSWPTLEELRHVANVVKHAEGGSAEELRNTRPEMFTALSIREDALDAVAPHRSLFMPLSGGDFYVTEKDLERYFKAAVAFWRSMVIDLRGL